jgi:hypothetical protein
MQALPARPCRLCAADGQSAESVAVETAFAVADAAPTVAVGAFAAVLVEARRMELAPASHPFPRPSRQLGIFPQSPRPKKTVMLLPPNSLRQRTPPRLWLPKPLQRRLRRRPGPACSRSQRPLPRLHLSRHLQLPKTNPRWLHLRPLRTRSPKRQQWKQRSCPYRLRQTRSHLK